MQRGQNVPGGPVGDKMMLQTKELLEAARFKFIHSRKSVQGP